MSFEHERSNIETHRAGAHAGFLTSVGSRGARRILASVGVEQRRTQDYSQCRSGAGALTGL